MKFEDLSNKDKAMYTYNQIQNKRAAAKDKIKQTEANNYTRELIERKRRAH